MAWGWVRCSWPGLGPFPAAQRPDGEGVLMREPVNDGPEGRAWFGGAGGRGSTEDGGELGMPHSRHLHRLFPRVLSLSYHGQRINSSVMLSCRPDHEHTLPYRQNIVVLLKITYPF